MAAPLQAAGFTDDELRHRHATRPQHDKPLRAGGDQLHQQQAQALGIDARPSHYQHRQGRQVTPIEAGGVSVRRAADRQPQGRNRGRWPAVEIDHHLPLCRHQITGAGIGQFSGMGGQVAAG